MTCRVESLQTWINYILLWKLVLNEGCFIYLINLINTNIYTIMFIKTSSNLFLGPRMVIGVYLTVLELDHTMMVIWIDQLFSCGNFISEWGWWQSYVLKPEERWAREGWYSGWNICVLKECNYIRVSKGLEGLACYTCSLGQETIFNSQPVQATYNLPDSFYI